MLLPTPALSGSGPLHHLVVDVEAVVEQPGDAAADWLELDDAALDAGVGALGRVSYSCPGCRPVLERIWVQIDIKYILHLQRILGACALLTFFPQGK